LPGRFRPPSASDRRGANTHIGRAGLHAACWHSRGATASTSRARRLDRIMRAARRPRIPSNPLPRSVRAAPRHARLPLAAGLIALLLLAACRDARPRSVSSTRYGRGGGPACA